MARICLRLITTLAFLVLFMNLYLMLCRAIIHVASHHWTGSSLWHSSISSSNSHGLGHLLIRSRLYGWYVSNSRPEMVSIFQKDVVSYASHDQWPDSSIRRRQESTRHAFATLSSSSGILLGRVGRGWERGMDRTSGLVKFG